MAKSIVIRLQVNGGSHHEIRLGCMAFCIEDVERIVDTFLKSERVEVHCAKDLRVLATDIHNEAVVDEHPHVVVTVEFKVLARNVFERGLNLHGETEIVSFVAFARKVIEVGVLEGLFGIEVFEIIEQEEPAFSAIVVFLAEPEAVILELQFDRTAGGVGVRNAVLSGDDFWQEPLSEMCCNLAIFWEGIGWYGYAIGTKVFLNHSSGMLCASAGTEVRTHAVGGVAVFAFSIAIAL